MNVNFILVFGIFILVLLPILFISSKILLIFLEFPATFNPIIIIIVVAVVVDLDTVIYLLLFYLIVIVIVITVIIFRVFWYFG